MFGIFNNLGKKGRISAQAANLPPSRCRIYYREPMANGPGVFVEIRGEQDHMVYVANKGVTPAYLNTPYDQWCRESLIESYVFATLDSAIDYFQNRQGGIKLDLLAAIRGQSVA